MVNMIGFHHREPVYNTAAPGEPGFYINELSRPNDEFPERAIMSSPCTRCLIESPEHARAIIEKDNPTMPLFARRYLENRGLDD